MVTIALVVATAVVAAAAPPPMHTDTSRPMALPPPPPPPIQLLPEQLQTGDLLFVQPQLDPAASGLDSAILATGAATLHWLQAHGVAVCTRTFARFRRQRWCHDH